MATTIKLRNITSGISQVGAFVKINSTNKKGFEYVTDLATLDVIGTVATYTPPGGMTTITLLGGGGGGDGGGYSYFPSGW